MAMMYPESERQRRRTNGTAKARRQKRAALIADLKRCYGCANCGETDPDVLDFHHLNPDQKRFTVSDMLYRLTLEELLAEIATCQVLCGNCHRKHHAQ